MARKKEFKVPLKLAQCADLLYQIKQDRLLLEKDIEAMKAQEFALKEHLIKQLPKGEASGIAGHIARVAVLAKIVPQVDTQADGWEKLYTFIKKTGAFELLQRRLTEKAVKDRWENGETVPGVNPVEVPTISLTKV
jgi:hypothetical protein